MGKKILIAIVYIYVFGRIIINLLVLIPTFTLLDDPSLGAIGPTVRSLILSLILSIVFALIPAILLFVKRSWFLCSLVLSAFLTVFMFLWNEYVTFQNAAALSGTAISLADYISPRLLLSFISPAIVWAYLYLIKPVKEHFSEEYKRIEPVK